MGLSKAAQNRVDELLVFDEPEFEELLRKDSRPLLSDGRCLAEADLVQKLTSHGIPMDRMWLWKLTREFPSSEALSHWLIRHNGLDESKMTIHRDWVWVAVDCLWDRWCAERPRFELLDQTIHEGYVTRRFDALEACRMWLLAWNQMQRLFGSFRFDTIDDFDDCFAGSISLGVWAQDLISLLKEASGIDPSLLATHERIFEEFVEHCYDCFGEGRSAELLEPMRAELQRARATSIPISTRRAA